MAVELKDANFSGADLSRMNLAGKDLREARFTEVNLSDTNLTNADLQPTH
jgi:uncharacterized protein YjbI with pentapeptide repeats